MIRPVGTHDSVPDNIGGWLHRVCANLITSEGRRRGVANRKKPILVDRTVAVSAEDRVIRMDEAARLRDALGQLPVDARVALLMAAAGFSPGKSVRRSVGLTTPLRHTSAAPESAFERSWHRARKPSHDGSRELRSPGSQTAQRATLFSGRGRALGASCRVLAMPIDCCRHATRQRWVAGRVGRCAGFAARSCSRAG